MSRNTILGAVALVVVLVAIPVGVVALGGDDGEQPPTEARVPAGKAVPGYNVPLGEDAADGEQESPRPQKPKRKPKPGTPTETHAKSFDEAMDGVAYPAAITRTGEHGVRAVEAVEGDEVESGQQTVVAADCRAGVCSIRYRSEPRGTGAIVQGQAAILRRLFARRDVRTVVLYVHHKTVGQRKEERPAFIVLTCRRSAHPGYDFSRIPPRQVARRCELVDNAGGKLRNEVRRGGTSVADASRGRGGGGGAANGQGADAPKGAKPPGTPAPRNVNGDDADEGEERNGDGAEGR